MYYYSMLIGIWGCAIDAFGIVIKYFLPSHISRSSHVWPVSLLFLLGGWSLYAPAQLLVLYSRLHLVNRNRSFQRWVLIMVILVVVATIVPSWIVDWPAFDPSPGDSFEWSPREAIVDRYTQPAFTCAEFTISTIYLWSLIKLLNLKSSVRQRRVMLDLIYVYVIVICLDILAISFVRSPRRSRLRAGNHILIIHQVFLNQPGISHPCQAFSYSLKFKLEFSVLNQLMAVAARGLRKGTYAERPYHHSSTGETSTTSGNLIWLKTSLTGSKQHPMDTQLSPMATPSPTKITIPSPSLARRTTDGVKFSPGYFVESRTSLDESSTAHPLSGYPKKGSSPKDNFVEPTPWSPSLPPLTEQDSVIRSRIDSRRLPLSSLLNPFRSHKHHDPADNELQPLTTRARTRQIPRMSRSSVCHRNGDDGLEGEIGVHMWENRGNSGLEAPWFKREAGV